MIAAKQEQILQLLGPVNPITDVRKYTNTLKKIIELSGGREEFVLPVTQEELAGMVGASRERVNKAIASFARLGWLEQHERNYRIIERDRLENRAR